MRACTLKRDRRDKKLWRLLPKKNTPYDHSKLSNRETAALTEALMDGFGDVNERGLSARRIPNGVKSGLLNHRYYLSPDDRFDVVDAGYVFWHQIGDVPPPFAFFPLNFVVRRLRVYFRNQFERYCAQTAREIGFTKPIRNKDRDLFEHWALAQLYQKPWYEVHALEYLDWIDDPDSRRSADRALMVMPFAGQLGRLVEQYFWRFRFERAAVKGTRSLKTDRAGGQARAAMFRAKQSIWQSAASEIWKCRPKLTKMAVAAAVRARLRSDRSAKHIARYIHHEK